MRADVYEGIVARAGEGVATRQSGDVILNVGRRYAVVVTGTGTTARQAADPAAFAVAAYGFTSVLTTTGEVQGKDGQAWRRIDDDTWAVREGLLIFEDIADAVDLAIELRVFSPREVRQALLKRDTPPRFVPASLPALTRVPTASATVLPPRGGATSTATRTPTRTATPTRTPTRTATATPAGRPGATRVGTPRPQLRPLFGVVISDSTRLYTRPGELVSSAPPLRIGAAIAVENRAVGADGQEALLLVNGQWIPANAAILVSSPGEASAIAYQVTMQSLGSEAPVDPDIAPALWLMRREARTKYLADTIHEQKIGVRAAEMDDPSTVALYSFGAREIRVNVDLLSVDVRVLTAAMAHEATHAWEHAQGLTLDERDPARCFEAELRAFRNQVMVWESFHGPNGKEKPTNATEIDLNEIQRLLAQDPQELKTRLVAKYGDQCGYHGPRPALPTPAPKPPSRTP